MIYFVQHTSPPASGTSGSASTTDYTKAVFGRIHKIVISYSANAPASTRVVITDKSDPAAESIADITGNTLVALYPRRAMTTNAGSNITYNGTYFVPTEYPVCDALAISITNTDPGVTVTVTAYIRS